MPEFWEEEAIEAQRDLRKQALRWGAVFVALMGGVFFALWWAGSAVHFSASRVEATTGPSYRVSGTVRDLSGAPVPWAEITDEPSGRPPIFHTTADRFGAYELLTIAEPHNLLVNALGFRPGRIRVGRAWYTWMPKGSEVADVRLVKE